MQDTKNASTLDRIDDPGAVFASTVPLEAIRSMLSHHMSMPKPNLSKHPDEDDVMVILDISRAHPHTFPSRDLYTKLPPEHPHVMRGARGAKSVPRTSQ